MKKGWIAKTAAIILIILAIALVWLATTENEWVWPRRNYVQYQALTRWWGFVGEPQSGAPATFSGVVQDASGNPIPDAWAILSRWDGTTFTARTDQNGNFTIADVPAGRYSPVIGAANYEPAILKRTQIDVGDNAPIDLALSAAVPRTVKPGQNLVISEPTEISCTSPFEVKATRREITFDSGGKPNQQTLLYTPSNTQEADKLPLLLAVYPGPADTWECVSAPLADAGYTVIGVGPAYSFDLLADVDELERLLDFTADGLFPNIDPSRIGILGGSYSGLHVQLLLRRERGDTQAALLLGAPTDLYTMRRHLEEGTYLPPFGLDLALISLGLPDRDPLRYWLGSGAFHVRDTLPPLLIIHSHADDVVPIEQSDLLIEQMEASGVTHRWQYFQGAGHYLLHPGGESQAVYDVTLNFLSEMLGE